MTSHRFAASLGYGVLTAALVCLFGAAPILAQPGAPPTSDSRAEVLQALGKAYAKDARVTFSGVDIDEKVTVGADAVAWTNRLQDALAVGYSPDVGAFYAIPLEKLKGVIKITMAGGRTPEETVKNVIKADRVVLHVTWHFASLEPVKTYVVFSPENELLFDTMMFLPVLRGHVFSPAY
ncbi:MAG TPA: hypothetical protein VHM88_07640 [Candidatus Acidoferrales bacterium]|nr:hypothetical protein [Candidatus Acidoferrales bacterium]